MMSKDREQLTMRAPRALMEECRRIAGAEERPLSQVLVRLLRDALQARRESARDPGGVINDP
jgi:hypothetical protein